MYNGISDFKRSKDFLICVDSDGCAMDTMDIKHFKCFGPCMIDEWELGEWQEEIQDRWNVINLYSMTRGINRFAGVALALREIDEKYKKIAGIDVFYEWTQTAKELSNKSVEAMIGGDATGIFAKALSWSRAVNASITELSDDVKKPFEGAGEGLAAAHKIADVAVVSSANKEAVIEEWEKFGLTDSVDVLLCQDAGTKKHCIEQLSKLYDTENIVMVGDAPGDEKAASDNGVWFYPILVKKEKQSWDEFKNTALDKLNAHQFKDYAEAKKEEFYQNLQA